nr:hypothetical protein BaRGS_032816 [Batillaria attramentaria]
MQRGAFGHTTKEELKMPAVVVSLSNNALSSPYDQSNTGVRSTNSSVEFCWHGVNDPTITEVQYRFQHESLPLSEWSPVDIHKTSVILERGADKMPTGNLTAQHKPEMADGRLQKVCVNWKGRFYNNELRNNDFLKPVKPDNGREIHGDYDQQSGLLPVNGTDNVMGIVKFEMAWSRDNSERTPWVVVHDLHAQTTCVQEPIKDGETYDVWIRATDIMDNNKCEIHRYLLDFIHLASTNASIRKHNREYYITITATNNAILHSRQMIDILIDASPPTEGVVLEGLSDDDQDEMDFTSSDVVHVRWHGFLDHESGILLYRVVLADRCLTDEEMDAAQDAVKVEEGNMTTLTFPSGVFATELVYETDDAFDDDDDDDNDDDDDDDDV